MSVAQSPFRPVDERMFGWAEPATEKTERDNAIHDADDSKGL
jgi:hypothetical protein